MFACGDSVCITLSSLELMLRAASWLPKYYTNTYGLTLNSAVLLAASFIFPASLLRPLGGYLSDKFGPRIVTYVVFITLTVTLAVLSVPKGIYFGFRYEPSLYLFATLMFIVGCGMGIGKASVYKYIPNYFPNDVGAVGGVVGMLGALGGFFLPPLFGFLNRSTGVPQMAIVALLGLTLICLVWLHLSVAKIRSAERNVSRAKSFDNLKLKNPIETEMAV